MPKPYWVVTLQGRYRGKQRMGVYADDEAQARDHVMHTQFGKDNGPIVKVERKSRAKYMKE